MKAAELKQAMEIAESDVELGFDGMEIFDGFGLADFKPVTVTLTAVARLIRWQCFTFAGTIDGEALDEIATLGRKRFLIAGVGK